MKIRRERISNEESDDTNEENENLHEEEYLLNPSNTEFDIFTQLVEESLNDPKMAVLTTGSKRGRPKKDPKQLHPSTMRRKFNAEVETIKKGVETLNKKSEQNGWGLKLLLDGSIVSKTSAKKVLTSSDGPELVKDLNIRVRKLAYLKLK